MTPSFSNDDFFDRLPTIRYDTVSIRDYCLANLDSFGYLESKAVSVSTNRARAGFLPNHFLDDINRQVHITPEANELFVRFQTLNDQPERAYDRLFTHPIVLVNDDQKPYNLHTDTYRPSSLNFLIHGDGTSATTYFEWRGGSVPLNYNPNEATLFNNQLPHRVEYHQSGLRLLLMFRCVIGFQNFMAFLEQDYITIEG